MSLLPHEVVWGISLFGSNQTLGGGGISLFGSNQTIFFWDKHVCLFEQKTFFLALGVRKTHTDEAWFSPPKGIFFHTPHPLPNFALGVGKNTQIRSNSVTNKAVFF